MRLLELSLMITRKEWTPESTKPGFLWTCVLCSTAVCRGIKILIEMLPVFEESIQDRFCVEFLVSSKRLASCRLLLQSFLHLWVSKSLLSSQPFTLKIRSLITFHVSSISINWIEIRCQVYQSLWWWVSKSHGQADYMHTVYIKKKNKIKKLPTEAAETAIILWHFTTVSPIFFLHNTLLSPLL